ncbi:hypothetical protein MUK42_34768 [Musa troglodytarum]|uniref:Uncharacterized protein n=1 Tax=Musa troglodytarum TaxID=320322 RepID=A0A9E7JD81_9LILI|nr:hypothetical protein MUK42_34768 [Musa troglodytarum]
MFLSEVVNILEHELFSYLYAWCCICFQMHMVFLTMYTWACLFF